MRRICCYSTVSTSYLPTIYALSTPPGQRSAIAVVRISGSQAKYIYRKLTRSERDPIPRAAILKKLYGPASSNEPRSNLLDQALTLFFKSPKTFTGEDILELHLHGGKAVTRSVLKAIESMHDRENGINIRYAVGGEFSQRAFQNGKFDLTEIEGTRELIDAETESQRRSALSSFNGENKDKFTKWRAKIVKNIAQLTAIIDFGDDTEIKDIEKIFNTVEATILQLKDEIKTFTTKIDKSSILQSGINVVLLGQPNSGKSSLINRISSDEVSIVSQVPGTTRDTIETIIDVQGFKVRMCDTAGIREESTDKIELLGIEKAKKKSYHSDICLLLIDPNQKPLVSTEMKRILMSSRMINKEVIIVINKKDLITAPGHMTSIESSLGKALGREHTIIAVSCLTSDGIETLVRKLADRFQMISDSNDDSDPILVSQRVREILENDVVYGLDQFLMSKTYDKDIVMASENLRHAADGIGKITGETVGIEEVLGVVFANFCVGK